MKFINFLDLYNGLYIKDYEKTEITKQKYIFKLKFIKLGYLMDDDFLSLSTENLKEIYGFLKFKRPNNKSLHNTFQDNWGDVKEKSEIEKRIEQIFYYIDSFYLFKNKLDKFENEVEEKDNSFRMIPLKFFSREGVLEKLRNTFYGKIALGGDTLKKLSKDIERLGVSENEIDIDKVGVKELKIILYKHFGRAPKNTLEFIKYLYYLKLEGYENVSPSLFVMNVDNLRVVYDSKVSVKDLIEEHGIEKVSVYFNRFKKFFLSLKGVKKDKNTINRLSKLSKIYHRRTVKKDILNDLVSGYGLEDSMEFKNTVENYIENSIEGNSHYMKIFDKKVTDILKVYNHINFLMEFGENKLYNIRNGSVWIDMEGKGKENLNNKSLLIKRSVLIYVIRYKLKHLDNKTILLDKQIEWGVPYSQKKFFGKIPFGTIVKSTNTKNIMFGVSWDSKSKIRDNDLSAVGENTKVGWNANKKMEGDKLLFSGDVVEPTEEGVSEILSIQGDKGLEEDYIVSNSIYSGSVNGKYDINVGLKNNSEGEFEKGQMMDTTDIILNAKDYSQGKRNSFLGIIGFDNKFQTNTFTFWSNNLDDRQMSSTNPLVSKAIKIIRNKIDSYYTLNDILTNFTNAKLVYSDEGVDVDFDLTPDKISIEKFFNVLEE